MTKRHLRLAKLLFETLDTRSFSMTAEEFSWYTSQYRQYEEAGWDGIGAQFGEVFRLRHEIRKARELGVRPGPSALQAALVIRGELRMQDLLSNDYPAKGGFNPHAKPDKPLPAITHRVGGTIH